jgi:hypothetical protein
MTVVSDRRDNETWQAIWQAWRELFDREWVRRVRGGPSTNPWYYDPTEDAVSQQASHHRP